MLGAVPGAERLALPGQRRNLEGPASHWAFSDWKLIEGGSRRDTDLSLKPSHASPLKYDRKPCFVVKAIRDYIGGKRREMRQELVEQAKGKLSNF